jgi:mRNA-degrading endonuclease toxin of MazEF toxin-antitoxin module
MLKVNKGDIYYIDLKETTGHVQGKKRPCIVLSVNGSISTILPLTSKLKRLDLKSHVSIETMDNKGNRYKSMCLLEQIQTINNDDIINHYGTINNRDKMLITNRLNQFLSI